jgi:hypothetical protein
MSCGDKRKIFLPLTGKHRHNFIIITSFEKLLGCYVFLKTAMNNTKNRINKNRK